MEFSLQQIAHILGGKVQGNENLKINNLGKIQDAKSGEIAFLSNLKYEPFIYTTNATAVIVGEDFVPKQPINAALIIVKDAYTAFSLLLEEYHKIITFSKKGIEQPVFLGENTQIGDKIYLGAFAYVGNKTQIGENCKIYPQTYIGDNVRIGKNTIIYAGVKIYADTVIGENCVIHAGAVIGSDGFGFAPQPDGSYKTIPQIGNVIIENNVSIGANTVIDCATMGSTLICEGVKLDNLIQIAHNVILRKNTVVAAQAGISGSTELGENCVIAGQVGIAGHLKLGNRTSVGAQSGVGKDTEDGKNIQGYPAFEIMKFQRSTALFRKLPDIQKQINDIEKKLKDFTNGL